MASVRFPPFASIPLALPAVIEAKLAELLFNAVRDFLQKELPQLAKNKEDELNAKLQRISVGDKFLDYLVTDVKPNSFFLLLRFTDFAAKVIPDFSAFPPKFKEIPGLKINLARATVELERHVNLTNSQQPIVRLIDIPAFAVEIAISWEAYSIIIGGGADIGFNQYKVQLDWKKPPLRFYGYLARSNADGFVISVHSPLPFPIPIGSTGIGLSGVGLTYGERFAPRFPQSNPTNAIKEMQRASAKEYVDWARQGDLEKWIPVKEALRIYGLSADLCEMATGGRIIKVYKHGMTFLSYGPTLLLGGTLRIVDSTDVGQILGAIDLRSESLFLSASASLDLIPWAPEVLLFAGSVELSASLRDQNKTWVAIGGYAMEGCRVRLLKLLELWGGPVLFHCKAPRRERELASRAVEDSWVSVVGTVLK